MRCNKVFTIIMIAVMVLFTGTCAFADADIQVNVNNAMVFNDVPSNHWAKSQIESFASQGILDGYNDGSFKPNDGVTREQFCKLLVNCFGAELATTDTPSFSDVSEGRWSYAYVETCKAFLTGYANPFGGLPSFHPNEDATREDIAVALVRMMGLTGSDASNEEYVYYQFTDGSDISPSLVPYVSVACEKGLISGYPNGTFKPLNGITRAEAVALLSRAMKQAVTTINEELYLYAEVSYSDTGETATLKILADQGTTVTVDGQSVEMSEQYYGDKYEGTYNYKFPQEGSKTFAISGTKAGKTKDLSVTAKYEVSLPKIEITSCPTNVTDKEITIRGNVTDENYSVSLNINGNSVYLQSGGYFSKDYTLDEGENKFVFEATNSVGKKATVEKTVVFSVGGPEIKITSCPTNVTDKEITIRGNVTDENYSVSLNINGNSVYLQSGGYFSKDYTLDEGENKFVFEATNSVGKKATVERIVNLSLGNPELLFINCPQTTTKDEVTIKGKITGANSEAILYINDEEVRVGYSKDFSVTYDLSEGANTFRFRAVNGDGKSVEETKTIVYQPEVTE